MSEETDIARALGRLEAKVDTLLSMEARRDEQIAHLETRVSAAEQKLTIVETKASNNRAWAAALWSGAIALAGLGLTLFDKLH